MKCMTSILLEHQGATHPFLGIPLCQSSLTRAEKDREHRAQMLALTDFCLNEGDQLEREEIMGM